MYNYFEQKQAILHLLMGSIISRAVYVAADLGIADFLVSGEQNIEDLSTQLNVDQQSLFRLMRMLASHRVFKQNNNSFSLTSLGECLLSEGEQSLRDFILKEDETRWRSLGKLKDAIVNGTPAFDQIYGKSYFEYLATDSLLNSRFEGGMTNLTHEEDDVIADALKIDGAQVIVDVGGGRGGFISTILNKFSSLEGILFELPHVVFSSNELLLNGLNERCQIVSGSFFESVPQGGDFYILKRILHDWDDKSCELILKNCCAALNPGGRVVVVESIMPSDNQKHLIKDFDVYMMTLFSGRQRTESEFQELFHSSGLKIERVLATNTMLHLIEATAN